MTWERCPRCGRDHVTVHARDEREVGETENLLISVGREAGQRSVMPALALRVEWVWLRCLGCDHRWKG